MVNMLPTPSTSHVNYDQVYEPSEDSFLLIDTLSSQSETDFLKQRFPNTTTTPVVLEVGVGSGVVLGFVAAIAQRLFGRQDVATLGVDVSHFATAAAVQTAQRATSESRSLGLDHGILLDVLAGDLVSPFKTGSIDMLIFNPPYVPSETVPIILDDQEDSSVQSMDIFQRDSNLLYLATDGGFQGMEVTNRLLDQLPEVLSCRGIAYVLLCAQNKPDEVMARIQSWSEGVWKVEKVGSSGKKAGREKLCVIRIVRVHTARA